MKTFCVHIRVCTCLLCFYKTYKIIGDGDFFELTKSPASQVSIEKLFYNESMDDINAIELLHSTIQIFRDALSPLVRTLRLHGEEITQNSETEGLEGLSFLNKNVLIPFLYELSLTEWEETLQNETFEGLLTKINSIYEDYNDCLCNPGFLQSYRPTFQTYQNDISSLKNLISETDPAQFANVLQAIDTYVEKETRLSNPPVDVEGQFQEFSKWFITEEDLGCDLSSSEVLATTDMSVVYKLSQSDKSYALKEWQSSSFATQKDFDRIKNEIRATIEHQGILFVPFIGIFHDTKYQKWFLVSEFMENGSLRGKLDEMNGTERTIVALGIAKGLDILHKEGIMHRDVKTDNILLDGSMQPRLMDFGLARMEPKSGGSLTRNVGTMVWMAPEVYNGKRYTQKADVFSYGVILQNMLQLYDATFECRELEEVKRLQFKCMQPNPNDRIDIETVVSAFERGKACFPDTDTEKVKRYVSSYKLEEPGEENWEKSEFVRDIFEGIAEDKTEIACKKLVDVYVRESHVEKFECDYVRTVVSVAKKFIGVPQETKILSELILSMITRQFDLFEEHQGCELVVEMFEKGEGVYSEELLAALGIAFATKHVKITDGVLDRLLEYLRSTDCDYSLSALKRFTMFLAVDTISKQFYDAAKLILEFCREDHEFIDMSLVYLNEYLVRNPEFSQELAPHMGRLCQMASEYDNHGLLKLIAKAFNTDPGEDAMRMVLDRLKKFTDAESYDLDVVLEVVIKAISFHTPVLSELMSCGILENVKRSICKDGKHENVEKFFAILKLIIPINSNHEYLESIIPSAQEMLEKNPKFFLLVADLYSKWYEHDHQSLSNMAPLKEFVSPALQERFEGSAWNLCRVLADDENGTALLVSWNVHLVLIDLLKHNPKILSLLKQMCLFLSNIDFVLPAIPLVCDCVNKDVYKEDAIYILKKVGGHQGFIGTVKQKGYEELLLKLSSSSDDENCLEALYILLSNPGAGEWVQANKMTSMDLIKNLVASRQGSSIPPIIVDILSVILPIGELATHFRETYPTVLESMLPVIDSNSRLYALLTQ